MKTLRLLRNISVVFILAMALLSLRPGLGVAHAASGKSCGLKEGFENCSSDASGNCTDSRCHKGTIKNGGGLCLNSGCV
jgi:hypothetical protein